MLILKNRGAVPAVAQWREGERERQQNAEVRRSFLWDWVFITTPLATVYKHDLHGFVMFCVCVCLSKY